MKNSEPSASRRIVDASIRDVLAYACVSDSDKDSEREKIFLRVPGAVKKAWLQMCLDRSIDQNKAGEALVRLIVKQEPEAQAMLLGQIPAADDVVDVLLKRMAGKRRGGGRQVRIQTDEAGNVLNREERRRPSDRERPS